MKRESTMTKWLYNKLTSQYKHPPTCAKCGKPIHAKEAYVVCEAGNQHYRRYHHRECYEGLFITI